MIEVTTPWNDCTFASEPDVSTCTSEEFVGSTVNVEFPTPDHMMTTRLGAGGTEIILEFSATSRSRFAACVISVTALCDMTMVFRLGMLILEILLQLETSRSCRLAYRAGMDESLVLDAFSVRSDVGNEVGI